MLRRLDVTALKPLVKSGYESAVLAESIADKANRNVYIPALIEGTGMNFADYSTSASSFQGATPEYMEDMGGAVITTLNVPFSSPLLAYINRASYDVAVTVDHMAWARELGFTLAWLTFRDLTLAEFLSLVRVQGGRLILTAFRESIEAHRAEDDRHIWTYKSPQILTEAQELGAAAFEGPWRCNIQSGYLDGPRKQAWQALGFWLSRYT